MVEYLQARAIFVKQYSQPYFQAVSCNSSSGSSSITTGHYVLNKDVYEKPVRVASVCCAVVWFRLNFTRRLLSRCAPLSYRLMQSVGNTRGSPAYCIAAVARPSTRTVSGAGRTLQRHACSWTRAILHRLLFIWHYSLFYSRPTPSYCFHAADKQV